MRCSYHKTKKKETNFIFTRNYMILVRKTLSNKGEYINQLEFVIQLGKFDLKLAEIAHYILETRCYTKQNKYYYIKN